MLKGIYRYRCRRDPGKLYNKFCYTYLTKDQPPSSNLIVYSTIQCSTIEIMILYQSSTYQNTPRPFGHKKRLGGIKGYEYRTSS